MLLKISYSTNLMTEDSTLLCSASDTVCRAMASLAAICFFFRLFRLWDGDHSCSHKNGSLLFKTRGRKDKSVCSDMSYAHEGCFQIVNEMQFIKSCNIYRNEIAMQGIEDYNVLYKFFPMVEEFIWYNEAAALLLSFWKSFKPIF